MGVVSILSGSSCSEVADKKVWFIMYSLIAAKLIKSGVPGRDEPVVNKAVFTLVQLTFSFR